MPASPCRVQQSPANPQRISKNPGKIPRIRCIGKISLGTAMEGRSIPKNPKASRKKSLQVPWKRPRISVLRIPGWISANQRRAGAGWTSAVSPHLRSSFHSVIAAPAAKFISSSLLHYLFFFFLQHIFNFFLLVCWFLLSHLIFSCNFVVVVVLKTQTKAKFVYLFVFFVVD